jgi:type I site-specific restriction-modification system R (restriction) subunit
MKRILVLFIAIGMVFPGYSQGQSKQDKILKLIELSGSARLGEQVAKNLIGSFRNIYSNVPDEFWDGFSKEIKSEDIRDLVVPIYDKYYNEDDIDHLIEFYSSPTGQKMIQVAPMIMQESMSAGQIWGEKIATKVIEELKEKGYINNE